MALDRNVELDCAIAFASPVTDEELVPMSAVGVVHDLGNLIQIASAAIGLISRSPRMPALRREPMLAKASTSLDHAGALVRQTLGSMRDRSRSIGDVSVAACLFDVKELVDSMWEPALELDIWIEIDLPKIRCDPLGLKNAILNLVFNAREAMTHEGAVVIRARRSIGGDEQAGIVISVADSGIGMSADTIARAFEPFFTTKTDGMGGVGLPMVDRFVREAGGQISIESERGAGTTVTIDLPAIDRGAPDEFANHTQNSGIGS